MLFTAISSGIDYVLGLLPSAVLRADPVIVTVADACAVRRAKAQHPVLRNYAETRYGAKSWKCQRRVVARIEASTLGMDIRYVVTSLAEGSPEHIYDTLYCARGQAENLIKRHKSQLASDRTSCRLANANPVRLVLHTAAYWLLWRVQQTIPKAAALACAEFSTLRLRLIKVAARVMEPPVASGSRSLQPARMPAPSRPSPLRSNLRRARCRGSAAERPPHPQKPRKPVDR